MRLLWSPLAPFPAPAELSLRRVSASITAQLAALRSMAEYSFPESFGASKSVISCTLLRSLIPPVTIFRDCITVSLDGELPAACKSLKSVSHCLNVNSSYVFSRQGTGLANLWRSAAVCSAVLARISLCNNLRIEQPDNRSAPRRCGNILSSMLKQISCASCRSAAPCLDKSAGCPRTFSQALSQTLG